MLDVKRKIKTEEEFNILNKDKNKEGFKNFYLMLKQNFYSLDSFRKDA